MTNPSLTSWVSRMPARRLDSLITGRRRWPLAAFAGTLVAAVLAP
jgi:hypothetical protein